MSELTDGFIFGFHLLNCMGIDFDSDAAQKCIREVAEGHRVLRNCPEDELENMECNKRSTLEDPEHSLELNHLRDHFKQIDTKNIAIAQRLIAELPR